MEGARPPQQATASSTSDTITSSDGTHSLHIDSGEIAAGLLSLAKTGTAVVAAHGDSGVGKSALVLGSTGASAAADLDAAQVICINLRHLPGTTLNQFANMLGSPLAALLTELTAPRRLLVIDGADAVAEGRGEHLRYLIDAARDHGHRRRRRERSRPEGSRP